MGLPDVEDDQRGEESRIVESQAMSSTCAAIVSHDGKFRESQMFHHFDLILRHGALRISGVILPTRRLAAVAVSAEIGDHQIEVLSQQRCDLAPEYMRFGDAM